jgi:hypothetical protein
VLATAMVNPVKTIAAVKFRARAIEERNRVRNAMPWIEVREQDISRESFSTSQVESFSGSLEVLTSDSTLGVSVETTTISLEVSSSTPPWSVTSTTGTEGIIRWLMFGDVSSAVVSGGLSDSTLWSEFWTDSEVSLMMLWWESWAPSRTSSLAGLQPLNGRHVLRGWTAAQ